MSSQGPRIGALLAIAAVTAAVAAGVTALLVNIMERKEEGRTATFRVAELSEEVAQKVLADLLPPTTPRVITPELILDETAKMFGWTVEDICGKSRRRPLVTARQTGMYVMRELTDLSYPRIAEAFGGRDHTTVMYAVDKIKQQMTERHVIFDQVNELIARSDLDRPVVAGRDRVRAQLLARALETNDPGLATGRSSEHCGWRRFHSAREGRRSVAGGGREGGRPEARG